MCTREIKDNPALWCVTHCSSLHNVTLSLMSSVQHCPELCAALHCTVLPVLSCPVLSSVMPCAVFFFLITVNPNEHRELQCTPEEKEHWNNRRKSPGSVRVTTGEKVQGLRKKMPHRIDCNGAKEWHQQIFWQHQSSLTYTRIKRSRPSFPVKRSRHSQNIPTCSLLIWEVV